METLCKIYLELANVVPPSCVSSRELALQRWIDKYGVALMMISEGCENPGKVAAEIVAKCRESDCGRQILQADAAFERIRSLLRGLPRSATAESIDRVCAEALGEPEGQWPSEQGQFGVGA